MPERRRGQPDVWTLLPCDCFTTIDRKRCLVKTEMDVIVQKYPNPNRDSGRKPKPKFHYSFDINGTKFIVAGDSFPKAFGFCNVVEDPSIFTDVLS